jgi:hypothetical protein
MKLVRLAYAVVIFLSGLAMGALWSAGCKSAEDRQSGQPMSAALKPALAREVAKAKELYGEETAQFVKQFGDLTIRIRKYPIDAWASPDGRFVIRLFGSEETVASDLRDPDASGNAKKLVRNYSFSCGGRTYTCDFVRNIANSKMNCVQFHITDSQGRGVGYVDFDADGRWDELIDETEESPRFYYKDGLCWRQRSKKETKESNSAAGLHQDGDENRSDIPGGRQR